MAGPSFQFPELFSDARVEELKLLSWTAQHGPLALASVPTGPWHDLLVYLVLSDLLTVFSFEEARRRYSREGHPDMAAYFGPGDTLLLREMTIARNKAADDLYERRPPVGLRLTHSGRIRLSELKQALRAGREREPFGIIWDVRHWEQDLQIALLDAREESPLAVAYLDMNGLKQANDTYGHDVGDVALKIYLQAVASAIGDRGQAYRLGGDEVLVVLPNHDAPAAVQLLELVARKLMNERLEAKGSRVLLSTSAGVITSSDPSASPGNLRSAADKVQYRAKQKCKETMPRPSVIAVNGNDQMMVIKHDAEVDRNPA